MYEHSQCLLGGFLGGHDALLTHGGHNGDEQVLAGLEVLLDLLREVLVVGEVQVVLGLVLVVKEGKLTLSRDVKEGVLSTANVGRGHVVRGRADLLKLLRGEDVKRNNVRLGVTVLSGLGGRVLNDLAGAVTDHAVHSLLQRSGLDGVGRGGPGVGGVELCVRHVGRWCCVSDAVWCGVVWLERLERFIVGRGLPDQHSGHTHLQHPITQPRVSS